MEQEAAESLIQVKSSGVSSEAVTRVKNLLFRNLLIGIKDGRFFLGDLHCIDKQGNILLQDSVELPNIRRSEAKTDRQVLGLILIPRSERVSCQLYCSVEEKMSLLAL